MSTSWLGRIVCRCGHGRNHHRYSLLGLRCSSCACVYFAPVPGPPPATPTEENEE